MRKQRSGIRAERLFFALCILFAGILAAFFAIRAEKAADASRQIVQGQQRRALLELTERTERICAALSELNCGVTAERASELYLTLAADAATAQSCAVSVPMKDSLSRGILRFLSVCTAPRREDIPAQLKYGEDLLCVLQSAALHPSDTVYLTADALSDAENVQPVIRRSERTDDTVTPSDARRRALRYLGCTLSLRREKDGEPSECYRFSCENGFCDISRTDGSLVCLAVYRENLGTVCDGDAMSRSVSRFWQRAGVDSFLPLSVAVHDGLQYGEYRVKGTRFLLCLSSSTSRPAAFFRLPQHGK